MFGLKVFLLVVIFGNSGSIVIGDFYDKDECFRAAERVTWAANSAATCIEITR